MSADEKFEKLKEEVFRRFFEENPVFASYLGLHEPFDYQLPKGDTGHVLENLKILEESVKRMKETIDYNTLSDANKIDWHVLEKAVEANRFDFYERRQHERDPDAFDVIGGALFPMITRDYAPLEKRIEAIITRLEKVPLYLEEFQSRFDSSKPVKLWTEVAIESAQQMPGLFHFI